LALAIIVFAINNRTDVMVDVWPLPYAASVPVFAIAFIGIFVGFLWGGLVAWFGAGGIRQRARALRREVETEKREATYLKRRIERLETAEKEAAIPPAPLQAS
jgi:uncharacterized integral membrane protein